MKKKNLFKNRTQMIIYIAIFCLCILAFVYIGKYDFKKDIDTEAEQFSDIYNFVSKDNLYHFSNTTEVLNVLNGNGVILAGFPMNKWTNYTAAILDEVGKEVGIDKIYYYDFLKDRDESNGTYETIVNKLDVYITVDDVGQKDLHAPTVIVIKKGEVIGYFDDTALIKGTTTPELYYTNYEKNVIYEKYKTALLEYMNG